MTASTNQDAFHHRDLFRGVPDSDRTVRSGASALFTGRPVDLSASRFSLFVVFTAESFRRQTPLNSFCSFSMNTTRDHIRGFRPSHTLSRARVTNPEGPARSGVGR